METKIIPYARAYRTKCHQLKLEDAVKRIPDLVVYNIHMLIHQFTSALSAIDLDNMFLKYYLQSENLYRKKPFVVYPDCHFFVL